jgi:hypothetical protein
MGLVEIVMIASLATAVAYWFDRRRRCLPPWVSLCFVVVCIMCASVILIVFVREVWGDKEYVARCRLLSEFRYQALREGKNGLEAIARAQQEYFRDKGRYASGEELAGSKALAGGAWGEEIHGRGLVLEAYLYEVTVVTAEKNAAPHWWSYARPPGFAEFPWWPTETLFIDDSGRVLLRESNAGEVPAYKGGRVESGYDLEHWYEWEKVELARKGGWWQ